MKLQVQLSADGACGPPPGDAALTAAWCRPHPRVCCTVMFVAAALQVLDLESPVEASIECLPCDDSSMVLLRQQSQSARAETAARLLRHAVVLPAAAEWVWSPLEKLLVCRRTSTAMSMRRRPSKNTSGWREVARAGAPKQVSQPAADVTAAYKQQSCSKVHSEVASCPGSMTACGRLSCSSLTPEASGQCCLTCRTCVHVHVATMQLLSLHVLACRRHKPLRQGF